jgi:hypothetical protein
VQGWLIDPHSGLMSVEHYGGHFSRDGAHLDTSTGAAIAAPITEMITRAAVTKRMAGWSVSTSVGIIYGSLRTDLWEGQDGEGVEDE